MPKPSSATASLLCLLLCIGCGDSRSNQPGASRDIQAPENKSGLLDLSWRAEVGEWWWLSHDSTVTQKETGGDQPQDESRVAIRRRMAIGVLAVDDGDRPTRLSFRVDVNESTISLKQGGEWLGIPESTQALRPPPGTKFSAQWNAKLGRWEPEADAPAHVLAEATGDLQAMFESRFLREEIPESMVSRPGAWTAKDQGRIDNARRHLGPNAEYRLDLELLAETRDITDEFWHVIKGKRRLTGTLDNGDAQEGQLVMTGSSEVLVASRKPFRTHVESTATSTTKYRQPNRPDLVVENTIKTSERFEPLLD